MVDDIWKFRSEKYNDLFWVDDSSFQDVLIDSSNLNKSDLVLDVGSGTGIISQKIKPLVNHVISLDNSEDMLDKGDWDGVSKLKWDINKKIFVDSIFDKIISRMVFHHILDNLDKVFDECYDILKKDGMLIVAEGIPPTDDIEVVDWFKEMFKYKEDRITFLEKDLINYFQDAGFKDIKSYTYIIKNFEINNWLDNSGIDPIYINKILDLHYNANPTIKKAYNMKIESDKCFINSRQLIITGKK